MKKTSQEIKWYFFVIIGILMAVISAFFINKIGIFLIIGVLLVIYGIGKFLITKKIKSKINQEDISENMKRDEHASHKIELTNCPRCFSKVYKHQNFCHNCGCYLKA